MIKYIIVSGYYVFVGVLKCFQDDEFVIWSGMGKDIYFRNKFLDFFF